MRRTAWLVVLALFLVGCGQRISVKSMAPLRLKHTYALVIATSYPPDETTRVVLREMKEVMEFENQVFTPFFASPLQLKDKPESLKDVGDTLLLIKGIEFKPPPQASLTLKMEFFEYDTGEKNCRTTSVFCQCPRTQKEKALKILAKEAIRYILEEIKSPPDAFLSTGFGGLGDGGTEGGEVR